LVECIHEIGRDYSPDRTEKDRFYVPVSLFDAVADPEVLARGNELTGHKGGRVWEGGRTPSQEIFESKNSKNGAFLCTLKR